MCWKKMAQVTITINNREYGVACEDGQEARIYQLANILDDKAKLLTQGSGQINENMLLAMIGLILADEITELKKAPKAQTKTESLELDIERIRKLDNETAEKINSLTQRLNLLAKELNLL